MLNLAIPVLISGVLTIGFGAMIRRLWPESDRATAMGIGGLLGLGTLGFFLFFSQYLAPGEASFWVTLVAVGSGPFFLAKRHLRELFLPGRSQDSSTKGLEPLLLCLGIGLAVLFGLTGVLAPSTALDWDSLAYHLAIPKIWLEAGRITEVSFIHHSNFPQAFDMLFWLGLKLGDQTAAKGFVWCATLLGSLAVSGIAREHGGEQTSRWAAFAFLAVPMTIWLSGSAYIDIPHGLYAALGWMLWAGASPRDRGRLVLGAISLALAASTKYTGLQAIGIGLIVLLINPQLRRMAVPYVLIASVLAAPWYLKNWVTVGNPVYPFFYSVFGGKNWNAFSAAIYTEEQKTFGFAGISSLAQAIFGPAIVPGRFTNPAPTAGLGFAFASLGVVWLLAPIGAGLSVATPFVRRCLLAILAFLVLWFGLSQQSRYITSILPIASVLLAVWLSEASTGRTASFGKFATSLTGVVALFVTSRSLVTPRMPVVLGAVSGEEWLAGKVLEDGSRTPAQVGFALPAKAINELGKDSRVALYDEVFGFLLDVPYFWANPGHTTELDYAKMQSADDLVAGFKKLGITHVYLNAGQSRGEGASFDAWIAAMGLQGPPVPLVDRQSRMQDPRTAWKVLVAEAIASGKLQLVQAFGTRLIFRLVA